MGITEDAVRNIVPQFFCPYLVEKRMLSGLISNPLASECYKKPGFLSIFIVKNKDFS